MDIRIGNKVVDRHNHDQLSVALEQAYTSKIRPLCQCVKGGVEMYVARLNNHYLLKRMPNSGSKHAPVCDSYEPPIELSGLGEVNGRAIQEDASTGESALKLDFALSKTGKRGPLVNQGEAEKVSVRTDGSKLTPRGLLHYLWHEAGFTRWSPAMAGKRSWYVIRKYLLEAVGGKITKGTALNTRLYIPEMYSVERAADIEGRRRKLFQEVFSSDKGAARSMMILIGEVKELTDTTFGKKCVIKHLPSTAFMLPKDLVKRMEKHFAIELECRASLIDSRLIALATFERTDAGIFWINEISLMNVDTNWIPFETIDEYALLEQLEKSNRYFVKGLRFNLAKSKPLATAVLSDTAPIPTALYVTQPAVDENYLEQIQELIEQSELNAWLWNCSETAMPELPVNARLVSIK